MHKLLQKYADSTIIFEFESSWSLASEFLILSKKGDTVTAYNYKSTPVVDKKNNSTSSSRDSLHLFWSDIDKLAPWRISDDSKDGKGCPVNKDGSKNGNYIYDGGGINLYLITKSEIKKLYFYAPGFFNKICPGSAGRQKILETERVFSSYFKQ